MRRIPARVTEAVVEELKTTNKSSRTISQEYGVSQSYVLKRCARKVQRPGECLCGKPLGHTDECRQHGVKQDNSKPFRFLNRAPPPKKVRKPLNVKVNEGEVYKMGHTKIFSKSLIESRQREFEKQKKWRVL